MGLTKHTGYGVPTIIKKYGKKAFEITGSFIKCKIPFDEIVLALRQKNVGLNKTEKAVLGLLIEDADRNANMIAKEVGVTKRTIERAFVSLQQKGKIERIGSKHDSSWTVIR